MPKEQRRRLKTRIAFTAKDQRYTLANQVNNGPKGNGYECPNATRIRAIQVGTCVTVKCGCHGVVMTNRYEGIFAHPEEVVSDFNDYQQKPNN